MNLDTRTERWRVADRSVHHQPAHRIERPSESMVSDCGTEYVTGYLFTLEDLMALEPFLCRRCRRGLAK